MEYLTDIDEFQAALKMVNVNEDMNVTKSNNVLLEGVELDCYHKCQKILDTPEMKKCHKRCLDVNFDELNESDIDTINKLYDLGIERGLINPDMETEPEENPEDKMYDKNVQDPLKDVGDGCELDDVDGDAYWEMKKALRECGEYGSIDKTIEEEIIDEEYPGNDEEIPPDVQIPEGEDPSMTEYPQSDELPIPDGYDEDELIAALSELDDKDVAPSDSEIEKMSSDLENTVKNNPEIEDDMPFESEDDDTSSDSEETSTEDTTTDTEDGDKVQDTSTNDTSTSSDTEISSDDTTATDDVETGDEGVEDETSDTETDSTEDTSTDDSETEDTTTSNNTDDSSTEDSDTEDVEGEESLDDDTEEDNDAEDSEDEENSEEEDKPEEKELTADDKAQLKNEYTNMFSDIVKGMLSDVEAEDGERAELCVKDMTPEQKSEFWSKVAEQWEGKADPADFMSASELESLENKVEKKEKEESSKED